MTPLFHMPWKTHAVMAVACPLILIAPAYMVYGFASTRFPTNDLTMSFGILLVAWLMALPLIRTEATAVACHRRSQARRIAGAAHLWLAFVGTLPVWVQFYLASPHPVDFTRVQMALNSYGLLLGGYLLATIAIAVAFERKQDRPGQAATTRDPTVPRTTEDAAGS